MKPATLLILLAVAIGVSVVVRVRTNNLSGGERSAPTDGPSAQMRKQLPERLGEARGNPVLQYAVSSATSSAPPAQSLDPEAQRIIGELVAEGFSPEDAAEAYRLATEHAREQRTNRPPMPGTRESIDTNRWPLFSEDKP